VPDDRDSGNPASADTIPSPGPGAVTPGVLAEATTVVERGLPIAEDQPPAPGLPSGMHERGKLGRFDMLDVLGQGGMGVVIAAYDPQLDRKVAIKVLRTRGLAGRRREKETARLQREARAMAQLSHPHVVTVYEAGVIDDRVYIAMEYVAGQTLRSWLDDKPRSVPEILDAYIKAGRGLAAGHHAGLVHRDFKPDNVLVGFDGRVRVIDFGLARPTRVHDTPSPIDDSEEIETEMASIHTRLTTVGTLFGTPIYMAPEQHQKLELDARADQFSFCVALYEALWGTLPFQGSSYAELATTVTEGKPRTPPPRPDIPQRVVDAILRGLQTEPDRRFPSMDDLLDALSPPAARRFGWLSIALGGVAALAIGVVVVLLLRSGAPEPVPPCLDGGDRMANVWNDAIKAQIRTAFLATNRSHKEDTLRRVTAELDRYAQQWIGDRRQICEATQVRHEQSEAAFDLRMRCMSDRLAGLDALAKELAKADPAVADRALAASRELGDLATCVTLTSSVAPPTAEQARRIETLRAEYHAAKVASSLGRYDRAASEAQRTLDHAAGLDYPPFVVEVEHLLGVALMGTSRFVEAERALRATLDLAARAKDDALIASTWTALISAIGADGKRYDEALGLRPIAETAIQRADNPPTLRAELLYAIGSVSLAKGDAQRAIESFEAALALPSDALDNVGLAVVQNALGAAYLRVGNVFAAKEAIEKSLATSQAAMGKDHPDVALALSSLGGLAQAMGAWDEAIQHHQRALEILVEIRGPKHEQVGLLLYSLGVSYNGKEDFKTALPYYERAAAIFEAISPSHPQLGLTLVGVADCLEETGAASRAVPIGERALELMESSTDETQLAVARFILAKALWAANVDRPRARRLAEQARISFKKAGLAALTGLAAVEKWFKKIDAAK